ncbi:hypothetical protein [Pengzhenrongella sicca]|uniref:Uncharacterized protein n=1 Tax=Pengzhenrongella sicca TaxID=2819238 RepID=A0A8A4Z8H3_9MICO|nr:hypothetical protein [Pengzhenrongella sicca]QTE28172.1 hypothetical protein J4E96_12310 [Pengzhenrongella sicca]
MASTLPSTPAPTAERVLARPQPAGHAPTAAHSPTTLAGLRSDRRWWAHLDALTGISPARPPATRA